MDTITLTETGCYLDSHRGHYITRDAIQLAQGYGFIIGQFEQFALDQYDDASCGEGYPHEGLVELCDAALAWLNSGQDKCDECCNGSHSADWTPGHVWETRIEPATGIIRPGRWVICKACTGTGRGPREAGQNFPPIVPAGTYWAFNDGDFGLYSEEDMD